MFYVLAVKGAKFQTFQRVALPLNQILDLPLCPVFGRSSAQTKAQQKMKTLHQFWTNMQSVVCWHLNGNTET